MTAAETLEAAIQSLATEGFASVSLAGQSTTVKSLDELARWLDRIKGAEVAAVDRPGLGIRMQHWTRYYP